ncbi:MAG: flavin reductase family protein [Actinobacteria bacterium]|nr:flavin reductase family protein [Actinomycetota bacterium]
MPHVLFDTKKLEGREGYFLITSLVIPRPIAWVSSLSPDGILNLAPHSYFNIISSDPLIVHFTSTGVKDSLTNVRATGEFVINIVTEDLLEQMNDSSTRFPPEENEFEWAGLETAPSVHVAPPRVAAAPAALECKLNQIVSLGNGNMVFGDVTAIHVDEAVMEDGRVMPDLLRPLARLGGSNYATVAGHTLKLPRPTWEEMQQRGKP